MKINKDLKAYLELIIGCEKPEIEAELSDYDDDWHQEEFDNAIKKAKANNALVEGFDLDKNLLIKIKKEA